MSDQFKDSSGRSLPEHDPPLQIAEWKYVDEPPERCPQCLGGMVEYKQGFICRICDYRWIHRAKITRQGGSSRRQAGPEPGRPWPEPEWLAKKQKRERLSNILE